MPSDPSLPEIDPLHFPRYLRPKDKGYAQVQKPHRRRSFEAVQG